MHTLSFGLLFNWHFQFEVSFWHILIAPSSCCLAFPWLPASHSLQRASCSSSWLFYTANYTVGGYWLPLIYLCIFILITVVGMSRSVLVIISKSRNPGFHLTSVRLPLNISCGLWYSAQTQWRTSLYLFLFSRVVFQGPWWIVDCILYGVWDNYRYIH